MAQESWGITSFVDRLALLGEETPNCHCSERCYSNVACNVENETLLGDDITIPMMEQACASGNNLMNLKRSLMEAQVFQYQWDNRNESCNVDVLAQNVMWHRDKIAEQLAQVNTLVEQYHDAIEQMLLRARRIVGPMEESLVAARTSCKEVSFQYQNVVDAWCYQGIYSLRILG